MLKQPVDVDVLRRQFGAACSECARKIRVSLANS